MKNIIALAALALAAFGISGCSEGASPGATTGGGTRISDGAGSATLYIVEKDGRKFAVLVGVNKAAMVELK